MLHDDGLRHVGDAGEEDDGVGPGRMTSKRLVPFLQVAASSLLSTSSSEQSVPLMALSNDKYVLKLNIRRLFLGVLPPTF